MGNKGISIFFLVIIVIVIAIIIAASITIYKLIYNIKINRQLQSDDNTGKQWPTPGKIVFSLIIVSLVLFCISLIIYNYNNHDQTGTYSVNQYTDYVSLTSEEIKESAYAHYVNAFESGELKGYDKVEKTENNFHYFYFISRDDYDILHPSFVLFVEYIGNSEYVGYNEDMKIYASDDNSWGSSSGGNISEYYCVIGNMDFSRMCGFNYKLSLFNDYEKMQEYKNSENDTTPKDIESISIWID